MTIISIEGIDGAGKTTFINFLRHTLRQRFPHLEINVIKFPSKENVIFSNLVKKFYQDLTIPVSIRYLFFVAAELSELSYLQKQKKVVP